MTKYWPWFVPALVFLFIALGAVTTRSNHVAKFNIGECFQSDTEREAWEEPLPIFKVVGIGKKSYNVRMHDNKGGYYPYKDSEPFLFNYMHKKVPCP